MRKPHPRLLLVEGKEDKWVIPQFMEKFIPWGERHEPEKWPADIVEFEGVEPLLKPGVIEAELKSPGLTALGVLDKALIHAWLALQNPPGQQLHSAIIQNILKPNSPQADPFVKWFRRLYMV